MAEMTLSQEHLETLLAGVPRDAARPADDRPRPISVLYGGAHLFKEGAPEKLGKTALAWLDRFGPVDVPLADLVHARVRQKLERGAVESMCIDFEDGYGPRPDEEEDRDAARAAKILGTMHGGPIVGIRIKPLAGGTARRAARTLDVFLTELDKHGVPPGFTVTLPKVTSVAEVTALADLLEALGHGQTGVELMVETPHALIDPSGRAPLAAIAGAARTVAVHLGAYDLTAALGVSAGDQRLDHPFCDVARATMKMAFAGTEIEVVDGATTLLPTGGDRDAVRHAWKMHASNVRRALDVGITRGWDLHPAQLPARYAAVYAFYLAERDAMAARLARFLEKATQATLAGQVFDDAATAQGIVGFFLRGLACGALDDDDLSKTGLTRDELRARSFAAIVASREAS